ncbi:MAG: T9SS type A sorting domain-containing protein [Bacteroidota bacterium]
MKKNLILFSFLLLTGLNFAQWTAFSNGNLREISCGSATELVGIAGTPTVSSLYKYNFISQSWVLYESAANTYYNKIAIASDGNMWSTGTISGGGFTRKHRPGNSPITQASSISHIDIQNVSRAVGVIGTGTNNVLENDGSSVFTTFSGFPNSAYRISIGEDGTIFALVNPTLMANNVFKYDGTSWINIPGNLYEIAVGDANKVAGLDGSGTRYYLKENQWVADLGAPFNTQRITVSSDGNVYILTNDATTNIFHNTWDAFACKPAQATITSPSSSYSICPSTSTTLTVSSEAQSVEWYQAGLLVGTGLSFTTPVLTTTTTYEIRTISNGCTNTKNITVTVNGTPTLTHTTPAANLEVCAGSTTTLTASGQNLRWYDSETAVNYIGFNGTFVTPNLTENTSFWVQASLGGCMTQRTQIDVTVLQTPPNPVNISNLGTVCPGPVALTVQSDYDVEWFATNASPTVLGTGLSYTIPNAVNGSIAYAQAVNGNCRSARLGIGISAYSGESNFTNPLNTTSADSLVVCNGGTTTLSATGQGIMQWSDAFSGGTILGTGNTFNTSAITQNTNIYYYALDGNCRSNIQYVTISTTSSTNTTPSENLSVCSGNTTILTGVGTNSPVSWFEEATSTSPLFTGNSFTTSSLENNTTFYLGHNHASCISERIPVAVSVTSTPAVPTINTSLSQQNVCVGNGAQITMNNTGTLSWFTTETGGSSISSANPLVIGTIGTPTTLTYYAQVNNGACFSDRTTVNITAQMNPQAPTNSTTAQNLTICEGNSTTLSVLNNNTLVWFDAHTGGNQLSTGATFTTPILNANQSFYVESQVLPAGCISPTRTTINVQVSEIPDAPINALGQNNVCSGNSITLEATATGNISWYYDLSLPFTVGTGSSFTTPVLSSNRSYFAGTENNGCYSSKTEFLINVNPVYQTTINEIACESYNFNGNNLTTSGTYSETFTTTAGCDSIVNLELTILNPTTSSLTESACDSYTLNGQTYTSSGVYTQILINSVGCDSTITLNLTINHPASATLTETGCLSYTLNGQTYTSDGTYIQNLTTVSGCDSTLTLNLTISNFATSTLNQIACSSFSLNGQVYSTSGVYTQTLTSSQGCDSIITLNLTVNYPNSSTLTEVACDSYELNGQTYTQSGTYIQDLTTINGCDSTITLNLTINNSSSSILTEIACSSFELNGQVYTSSGVYTQVIPNNAACDSTITLNLTINQVSSNTITEIACGSFTLNNEIFTQSGTYTQVIPNVSSCDSTITLNLTITPNSAFSFTEIACDSYTWNSETYTQTGVYEQIFVNSLGCDSIVTLNLTINNSTALILNETACNSYILNGETFTSSGTYFQTLTNSTGCDSTITLNLIIGQPSSSTLTEIACGSFILNNEVYTQSGTFTQVIPNVASCDSTITLNLTITPNSTSTFSETACNSYTWNSETHSQTGIYTQTFANSLGCDSIVTLNLTINNSSVLNLTEIACDSYELSGQTYTVSGSYTQILTTQNGCDSTINLSLTINNSSILNLTETACDSYELNGETYTVSGNYIQNLTTVNGCDSTINLSLTINSVDNSISQNNELLTANLSNATYQWIDCTNGNVAIAGETNQSFTASSNGEYSVQITQNSCTITSDCFTVSTLNLENINPQLNFSFYPNPSSNYIVVNTNENNSKLIIMDISGKIVLAETLLNKTSTLNIENLADGVYHLRLETESKNSVIQKLIITKH